MSKKRKHYSSEFKAKVALATIRADETVPQLAARHGLHSAQINTWKRQLIEQATELFSRGNGVKKESEHGVDNLHCVIGQLGQYFEFYNSERRHQSLDRQTPDQVYYNDVYRKAA